MAELAGSVAGHVSCAVAPVCHSYSERFEHGVLSDGSHGDLVLQMVCDKFGTWPSNTQSGPTTPLWWWKENADVTKAQYSTALSRFAMAGPTYGIDFNVTVGGNESRRPRTSVSGGSNPYFDGLSPVIAVSQADHLNNDDSFLVQWSLDCWDTCHLVLNERSALDRAVCEYLTDSRDDLL